MQVAVNLMMIGIWHDACLVQELFLMFLEVLKETRTPPRTYGSKCAGEMHTNIQFILFWYQYHLLTSACWKIQSNCDGLLVTPNKMTLKIFQVSEPLTMSYDRVPVKNLRRVRALWETTKAPGLKHRFHWFVPILHVGHLGCQNHVILEISKTHLVGPMTWPACCTNVRPQIGRTWKLGLTKIPWYQNDWLFSGHDPCWWQLFDGHAKSIKNQKIKGSDTIKHLMQCCIRSVDFSWLWKCPVQPSCQAGLFVQPSNQK